MAKIDYDNLTKQIVEYVGGVENIKTITHCVTRLRLYLNDRNKAEDEKIKNNRLALLLRVSRLVRDLADLTKIVQD